MELIWSHWKQSCLSSYLVYVVLSGMIETGGKICDGGTFWFTPANRKQRTHKAITDVEILTMRLGKIGEF